MDSHTPSQPGSSDSEAHIGRLGDRPLSAAQWIRATADGETSGLTPPDGLPGDADTRVEFDRSLRDMCSRTLGKTTCPQAVRDAVIAAMAREASAPQLQLNAHHADGVVRSSMGDTRSRSFWSSIGRFGALAAVLALGATVVYKGATSGGGPGHALPVQQASLLASFVQDRHDKVPTDADELAQRFAVHSIDDTATLCDAQLEGTPDNLHIAISDMHAAGISFIGVVPCDVPDQGPAVHLMFQASNELAPARVSLFIQRDATHISIKTSACYLVGCPKKSGRLVVWRTDGFMHYLYACTPESLAASRKLLRVPESELPL